MDGIRIALVDDDADDREFIVMALNESGDEIKVAPYSSGQTFVNSLSKETLPDLVITDLRMPLMNGFEVIRHLKEDRRTRDLPVVVLSTSGSESDRRRAAELGCIAYYEKPFTLDGYGSITSDIIGRFNRGVLGC